MKTKISYDPNLNFCNIDVSNKFMRIQTAYDQSILKQFIEACEKKLNKEQLKVYQSLTNNHESQSLKKGAILFLYPFTY